MTMLTQELATEKTHTPTGAAPYAGLRGPLEDRWLYDPVTTEGLVGRKVHQTAWRHVLASLRLLNAATRSHGRRRTALRLAAVDFLRLAESAIEPEASYEAGTSARGSAAHHPRGTTLTSPEQGVRWLRDSLLDDTEPTPDQTTQVLLTVAEALSGGPAGA